MNQTFYFTYGLTGHPFSGGWTQIKAPDINSACALFRAIHPNKTDGVLNCASVYTHDEFQRMVMNRDGNYGFRCRENITLSITRY